jgi:hypothetical protein
MQQVWGRSGIARRAIVCIHTIVCGAVPTLHELLLPRKLDDVIKQVIAQAI